MAKPYEKCDGTTETEDETTDQSEDPVSCSASSCLSNWDAGVEIPPIESSLRQTRACITAKTDVVERRKDLEPEPDASTAQHSCLKGQGSKSRQSIQYTRDVTLYLPICGTPLRKRTCVSFNPNVMVRHIHSMSKIARRRESLWFQPEEYSRMAKRCQLIAQKVMRDENHTGRSLCTRGLESLMCPDKRRDSKVEGWLSVFNEQEMQQQEGQYDEHNMRIMYHRTSSESLVEAQRRGMADEQDVRKYLQSTNCTC
ncbi:MAG: hypothetical protein SGBAC_005672 [Bacillariaceae sp.]